MEERMIRAATEKDLPHLGNLNAAVFLGHRGDSAAASEWLACMIRSHPRGHVFVAHEKDEILGYITWEIHGGFLRAEPVVELDQLAIDPKFQRNGIGRFLIEESSKQVVAWITARNSRIESVVTQVVWCYTLNFPAMKVYAETFGQPQGFRIQYGDRSETMFRRRIPVVRSVSS